MMHYIPSDHERIGKPLTPIDHMTLAGIGSTSTLCGKSLSEAGLTAQATPRTALVTQCDKCRRVYVDARH